MAKEKELNDPGKKEKKARQNAVWPFFIGCACLNWENREIIVTTLA